MTEQEMLSTVQAMKEKYREDERKWREIAPNMGALEPTCNEEAKTAQARAHALTRLLKGYKRRGEALKRVAALKYENVPKTPLLLDVITVASEALTPYTEEDTP